MGKKGKVVLAQPAALAPRTLSPVPRAPVRGGGDEAAYRASLRYRGLLQDYQDLLKETEATRRKLHMMKLMKQRLRAELKFLRKRYKSMSENPYQTVVCRVKNHHSSVPPPPTATGRAAAWAVDAEHRSVHAVGSSSKSLPVQQRRQLGPPRASPVIDLNEACEPSHEAVEMGEYHGFQDPLCIDGTRYPLESHVVATPSGVRMPVFRDIRNPAQRPGKRKISYPDQLVLGV